MAQIVPKTFIVKGETVTRYQVRWTSPGGKRTSRRVTTMAGAERLKGRIERAWLLSSPRVSEADLDGGNLIEGSDAIAAALGLDFQGFKYRLYEKTLPVFHIGRNIYALKTELAAHQRESGNVPAAETA